MVFFRQKNMSVRINSQEYSQRTIVGLIDPLRLCGIRSDPTGSYLFSIESYIEFMSLDSFLIKNLLILGANFHVFLLILALSWLRISYTFD